MRIRKLMNGWRYPSILLFSIGVSSVGSWIYFIALNLIVLNLTGSAMAVTGLYVVRALSTLLTNSWCGSLIDRYNKKLLMIILSFFQACLIAILPYFSSLVLMYSMVFLITMASSMYHPTSMTYITKLIPMEQRKRFNALRSLLDSGAFLTGPAIAGLMFTIGTPNMAIYVNAIALLVSAFITMAMPNVEAVEEFSRTEVRKLTVGLLKDDWKLVIQFTRNYSYTMLIYFLFSVMIVLMTATDSLEAAFATQVLSLSEGEYGLLVSSAGAGLLIGSVTNTFTVVKVPTSWLIGIGSLLTSVGYIVFSSSSTFHIAIVGCFVLSFASAFANTGFYTFYQNNIPVDVMGRIGSIYGVIEAFLVILLTVVFGILAEVISIRVVVITGAWIMLVIAIVLFVYNIQSSKSNLYSTSMKDFKEE
ncbi:MFS transporter [Sporosarcina aquimarina]|uniref:MFS transporter n=1 Tax=Sporosarcina aquimarina TaxID=114975 RepID=UPI00203F91E9|nr:MFS transporter [Sporosarcina aquimarina]MCM3757296.1 MFS transporter [Sporosarcina aquimarina]